MTTMTPEKRKAILDCCEEILRQAKDSTPERAAKIEEMRKKLELSEDEILSVGLALIAP